jgi:hypothetical protein
LFKRFKRAMVYTPDLAPLNDFLAMEEQEESSPGFGLTLQEGGYACVIAILQANKNRCSSEYFRRIMEEYLSQ